MDQIRLSTIASEIQIEVEKAVQKHRAMHSAHEGYAVILEELDELWDLVKMNTKKMDAPTLTIHNKCLREEAIQVAAMGMRFVLDVCGRENG